MMPSVDAFRSIVDQARSCILTTHINPDADGLGSECALACVLRDRGKQVRILNHSTTPSNYRFLDALFPILTYDPAQHTSDLVSADAIIVLDANHPDRLAGMKPAVMQSAARKICIDHHPDASDFAELMIIDTDSAATGMILYDLLQAIDPHSISQAVATGLYAAIMTDTGSFRFPKTDARVHTVVADLLKHGADPVQVYEEVYERGSAGRLRLLGRMLEGLRISHEGRVAAMTVTRAMFAETETDEPETDAFVPYTLSIRGVQIGIMFTELDGLVKINFRSKGSIPVNVLAQEFGGNGHTNAAGARVTGARLDELMPRVLERAGAYIR